ncbi:nucleolar transcription factor 1-like [Papaver somniferum]|uniref:nucleolar transcription factor 1-like n=1 Tax=Papaver somniferum TaxID=3469 RepID=UPI000E6F6D41|nr:nucleolar transcription factor 1-like [Papaver somniferum]
MAAPGNNPAPEFSERCSRNIEPKKVRGFEDIINQPFSEARKLIQGLSLAHLEAVRVGISSDSYAEEVESVWKPVERETEPYPPGMRTARLAKADFEIEREEDDYLDATYDDPEDHLEETPEDGSDEGFKGNSTEEEDDDRADDTDSDESDG